MKHLLQSKDFFWNFSWSSWDRTHLEKFVLLTHIKQSSLQMLILSATEIFGLAVWAASSFPEQDSILFAGPGFGDEGTVGWAHQTANLQRCSRQCTSYRFDFESQGLMWNESPHVRNVAWSMTVTLLICAFHPMISWMHATRKQEWAQCSNICSTPPLKCSSSAHSSTRKSLWKLAVTSCCTHWKQAGINRGAVCIPHSRSSSFHWSYHHWSHGRCMTLIPLCNCWV